MKDQNSLLNEIDIEQELEYERLLDEHGANEDEDEEEEEEFEEEEVYCNALRALQTHQRELDSLYSAAGMFWLGMSWGGEHFAFYMAGKRTRP